MAVSLAFPFDDALCMTCAHTMHQTRAPRHVGPHTRRRLRETSFCTALSPRSVRALGCTCLQSYWGRWKRLDWRTWHFGWVIRRQGASGVACELAWFWLSLLPAPMAPMAAGCCNTRRAAYKLKSLLPALGAVALLHDQSATSAPRLHAHDHTTLQQCVPLPHAQAAPLLHPSIYCSGSCFEQPQLRHQECTHPALPHAVARHSTPCQQRSSSSSSSSSASASRGGRSAPLPVLGERLAPACRAVQPRPVCGPAAAAARGCGSVPGQRRAHAQCSAAVGRCGRGAAEGRARGLCAPHAGGAVHNGGGGGVVSGAALCVHLWGCIRVRSRRPSALQDGVLQPMGLKRHRARHISHQNPMPKRRPAIRCCTAHSHLPPPPSPHSCSTGTPSSAFCSLTSSAASMRWAKSRCPSLACGSWGCQR